MQERRRYKRFKIEGMGIDGKMLFAKNVKILDMSVGGMLVETDKRLNPGSEHILKLKYKDKSIPIKSVVVWCLLGKSEKNPSGEVIPIYHAGMEFVNVTDEMRRKIARFIEDQKKESDKNVGIFQSSGRRLYIRFQIVTPEEVSDFFESCKIKELSLSGMLIESEHLYEVDNKMQMEVFLPEDEPITLSGRVASCYSVKVEDTMLYDLGIEFLEMSGEDRERLKKFIDHIEKKSMSE
ncbi:MAG: PilZ domain-containing protein [Nitrospirae bacterium]|nr:PilZ domain-containing protein [Nitrospirota bacterium]